jgi:uncharacterized repeat protein (TIGR03803 family)
MSKLFQHRVAGLFLSLCIFAITSSAQTLTTLHMFTGPDGSRPNILIQGSDGNFYGSTQNGGASGAGTLFEITPGGSFSVLQSFNNFANLALVESGGTFYGIESNWFYSIVPGGTLDVLNSNALPGPIITSSDGNFYGVFAGDATQPCTSNCGSIFELTPAGVLTTLYTFDGTGGYAPVMLVQGTGGNFYGITALGGTNQCGEVNHMPNSCGTIFQFTGAGVLTTLYTFCSQPNCVDGFDPQYLTQGTDGNFYGTTAFGGDVPPTSDYPIGDGTIFKITPRGVFSTLHVMQGSYVSGTEGSYATALSQARDGSLYGVAQTGGSNQAGTVFKLTPGGLLVTLHAFDVTDGQDPSSLVESGNSGFYGTTESGGSSNDGGIFNLAVALGGTTPSTTSLTLSPTTISPPGSDGPVVMTATVAPASGTTTPTGFVAFLNGSAEIGSANLNDGIATFNYNPSSLAVGTYPITALYNGDATFADSTSVQQLTVTSTQTATPSFSPAPGSYNTPQSVTISDTTPGATIYYTTDGTTPTMDSAVYSGPITVNSTETIEAMAAASGYSNSAVATGTYTITATPDYQVSVTPSALNIVAGQSGTATFTVTPINGFNLPVGLMCSGLPSEATCSFNPSSVTPSGSSVTSMLTVSTTAASASSRRPGSGSLRAFYAVLLPSLGLTLLIPIRCRSTRPTLGTLGIVVVLVLSVSLLSCGSGNGGGTGTGGNPGTPPGTSTVTVTAATSGSAAVSHTATLKITITQ